MTALRATAPADRLEQTIAEVRALYEATHPAKESGFFTEHDWNRCRAGVALIEGPAVLDVGIGAGQIFNVLARDSRIERLVGLDVRWNQKLIRPARGELQLGSIFHLPFADASFDTVMAMEVLEHLEVIEFPRALHELRRVCRGTLIMTVPYQEPEPLWHHDKPGGHRQQFSEEKIERWFPRAGRELIPRKKGACPWILLIERAR